MQNNELITIGIPVYNMESSIKNAIDSCLNQTYKNFEILVVNDGSTDNSIQVIKDNYKNELKSGKIRIYERPQNGGVCMAMRDIVDNAKGVYIAFLDADDTMMDTRIEEQYNAIVRARTEYPDRMIASFCGSLVNNLKTKKVYNINPYNLFNPSAGHSAFGGGTGHSMYKKEDILKLGNFDIRISRSSDSAMCVSFLMADGYYAMVNKPLITYNFINNSAKEKVNKADSLVLQEYIERAKQSLDNKMYLRRFAGEIKFRQKKYVKIFGIPLLKIKYFKDKFVKYYLFGILKIIEIKIKN